MNEYTKDDFIPTEFKIESPKSVVFITLHSGYGRARVVLPDEEQPVSYPMWLSRCLARAGNEARYIVIPRIQRDGEELPTEIVEVFKND